MCSESPRGTVNFRKAVTEKSQHENKPAHFHFLHLLLTLTLTGQSITGITQDQASQHPSTEQGSRAPSLCGQWIAAPEKTEPVLFRSVAPGRLTLLQWVVLPILVYGKH